MFGTKLGSKPKDAAFFDAFSKHAATSREAASMLVAMFARLETVDPAAAYAVDASADVPSNDPELERLARAIKDAETRGDTITHDTITSLHENWITPLDRDDIHTLVSRLDDVLDDIEAAADRIVLFGVRRAVPEAKELAETLERACAALEKATPMLASMKKSKEMLEHCVEVNRLENVADQIHRKAISALFQRGNDPLTVMKWRDIFESLESAADRCEDVANVLEGVVLEYA